MVQADELLMQIDDIHSVKLPGTSGLVHIAYSANELDALHLSGRLTFNTIQLTFNSNIQFNAFRVP